MKDFLKENAVNVSSDVIQTSSIGTVSEEILEKLEKVAQSMESEKLLCRPVPPVSMMNAEVAIDTTETLKTPKKSKKQKRDSLSEPSTKEKKKKKARTEEGTN